MLAAGYVCSTGIPKRTFENDFMKNLAFSLHWQVPSFYILQKTIDNVSQNLLNAAIAVFKEEHSSTLMVYPWMDVNKKCTLSFILYSPHDFIFFYDSFLCKQEEWNAEYITNQTNAVLDSLFQQGIHITMILYQDTIYFKELKDSFIQSPERGLIPYQIDCVSVCEFILNSIFSISFFMDLKEVVGW